jgi:phage terminase large subunit GpA-like protein
VGLSAEPGRIKLAPYLREIAAAMVDPAVERLTIQKSARIGYSTLLSSLIAYHLTEKPAPVLVVLPAQLDCRNYVIDIESIFDTSPALQGKLPTPATAGRASRNTLLFRRGAGGASLRLVSATAPRNLRAITAKVLLIDECDALLDTAEGAAIALAEARTLSFRDRRIVCGGTPLMQDSSYVAKGLAESDMRIFEICCPLCAAWFEITWPCIQWPEGRPEEAHCVCPGCGGMILEESKPGLVRGGRWRALQVGAPGPGFPHCRAPYRPPSGGNWRGSGCRSGTTTIGSGFFTMWFWGCLGPSERTRSPRTSLRGGRRALTSTTFRASALR